MTKNENIDRIKTHANGAKEDLMRREQELLEIGATKEAEQLSKIIIRLEVWQNR